MPRSKTPLADIYPHLEAFFCGYVHQDFPEEHGDLSGAVAAFRRDARQAERRAVRREWAAYRAEHSDATLKAVGDHLRRGFGSAWTPRKRADLEALDALIGGLR